jgi:hypothetical protein
MKAPAHRARRLRAVLATAALAAVAALLLPACGDEEEARKMLDRAFTTPIGSADVGLDASVELKGVRQLERPMRLQVRGPYRSGGGRAVPSADLDINFSASGQNFAAGLISNGRNAWVELMGQAYEVGERQVTEANRQIAARAGQDGNRSLRDFGVDARRWLDNPDIKGDEQIAGVETTHIETGIDMGRMLEDLNTAAQRAAGQAGAAGSGQLSAEQRDRIERIVQDPQFDVYVGKDNRVRRLSTVIELEVPEEDRRALRGAESGKVSFSIEFSNVGSPSPITPPPRARPLKDLTDQLLQLFGGGAGAGVPGAGGTTPGAPGALPAPGGAQP